MSLKTGSLILLFLSLMLQTPAGSASVERQYKAEYVDPQGRRLEFVYSSTKEDQHELALEMGKACFNTFKARGISSEEEGLKMIDSCANPRRVK